MVSNARTMTTLAYIHWQLNAVDETLSDTYQTANENSVAVWDALYALARDIINSPCVSALEGILSEEDIEELREYEELTEEDKALIAELDSLESEYFVLAADTYTAVVDGVEWTEDEAYAAYEDGELTYDEYWVISVAVAKAKNEVLGELYLRIVDAHKREAALDEYENYADEAYEGYGFSFTPEEVKEFHAAVKESMAPLYDYVIEVYNDVWMRMMQDEEAAGAIFADYTGDIALDIMEPYVASLSSELYESFSYMRQHHLYDSGFSDTKSDRGFTIELAAYGAPFFFNSPAGDISDLTTAIHEFGHYNNAYWTDGSWYHGSKSIDLAEVHSQALELLFLEFYPEIIGETASDFFTVFMIYNMVRSAIINGAMYDELQQFVFSTEDVTLQQINEKYCQLCHEYGVVDADDERTEMYGWVEIPHSFTQPLYYISYAVSAAGAFEFWLAGQDDYFTAVDDYLRFTAQKMDEYDFQESFEAVGLQSPFSAEYLSNLAAELMEVLRSYASLSAADYFTDVTGEEPWYEAVSALYSAGYLKGVKEGFLDAEGAMTRAQASTMLCRLFGVTDAAGADYFTDVAEGHWYTDMVNAAYELGVLHGFEDGTFRPGDSMSRQDFAVVMYGIFQMIGSGFDELWSFDLEAADAEEIGDYALEAVSWGVMNGYITVDENSDLRPTDDLTRAEMAEMIYLAFFGE